MPSNLLAPPFVSRQWATVSVHRIRAVRRCSAKSKLHMALDSSPGCTSVPLQVVFDHPSGSGSRKMPFWRDMATALGRDARCLKDDLNDSVVEDSLSEGVRTVLLCESPHKTEIREGHPLAGDSGKAVTRAFAQYHPDFYRHDVVGPDEPEPIGSLLHRLQSGDADEQLSDTAINGLNSLGLMNVSRLPLSSDAYCLGIRRNYSDLLCYFEAIKYKLEKKVEKGLRYLRELDTELPPLQVYEALRNDLIGRLSRLENVKVIPCGNVAKGFFNCAIEHGGNSNCVIPDFFVPHPSPKRRGWQKEEHQDRIRRLVDTIRRRAAPNAE